MKILYKQPTGSGGVLSGFGITECYYKHLLVARDRNSVTEAHHHTCFELHIITKGSQLYDAGGREYPLEVGQFLLIPPGMPHRVIRSGADTEKISVTFKLQADAASACIFGSASPVLTDSIAFITAEAARKKMISPTLIENRIFEMIVFVLRQAGISEENSSAGPGENTVVALAKQYIADNIENGPTVAEVAAYCYLSTKQLVRIFSSQEGIPPGTYILKERVKRIELLMADGSLTLRQISERMHFSSEYYFSAFFKKYAGMPPGEYRKMHGK